jgi:hypothetical protein
MFKQVLPKNKNEVEDFLKLTGIVSNFSSWHQLWAFIGSKPTCTLYLWGDQKKKSLILKKERDFIDIRLLFETASQDSPIIKQIKRRFRPQYIASNLIQQKPKNSFTKREDLIIDCHTIARLKDKKIKKKYLANIRNHPRLKLIDAKEIQKQKITDFLNAWSRMASIKFGKNITCANDRKFIQFFLGKRKVWGRVVLDKETNDVIGIFFFTYHPSSDDLAVSIIKKNLRGYTQLGILMEVEECRLALKQGFKKLLIGGTEIESQAKFKRQLLKNGQVNTYYSHLILDECEIVDSGKYLRDFWS